ncbi:MAG: Do family serine endopeptidase [Maricaulaceae bacterium]|jgi:Do/DeqQ family serine protease
MKRLPAASLFALVAAAVLGGATGLSLLGSHALAQPFSREAPQNAEQIQLSFAPVVRDAAPAVVNVFSERRVATRGSSFEQEFFERFFGYSAPRERVSRSLGSGVIVRSNGVIVTNNHVVAGATELRVVLSDRREFPAELMLADERTDLAVLKIDANGEDLPTLAFAPYQAHEVGDLVIAIGNPFGVGQTVTQGIISALGRSEVGVTDYGFFIQTDAAINPGNSGGALVDLSGELIGINTAIFSRSGGSNGIGFAIPAPLVERVVDSALSEGRIVRPWFGARGQTVTADLALTLGLDRPRGVLVNHVREASPADRAGVREGDVVLSLDGEEIDSESALRFLLATHRVGDRSDIAVWRDGRERRMTLRAEAPPETPARDERTVSGAFPLSGAKVANLSPAFNEEIGLDLYQTGVMIIDIPDSRSAAAYYGFRAGDLIVGVNRTETPTTAALEEALEDFEGDREWLISLIRNGQRYDQAFRF